MISAQWQFGDVLLSMLWLFLLVVWFWLLISIFADIFRDRTTSGWAKALWVVFVLVFPLLGVLVYLIVRGRDMAERALRQQEADRLDARDTARGGVSVADELTRLAQLRDQGVIDADEFARIKARLVAGTTQD
ncbi:hypothetical protein TH66_19660 [Carbonactinospora thermoautotrophica]|uniref:Putative integral membrane protein n=1 Tax=Carbonactinospora thermoautotrophica TaxID=1469144 RepID=A0A132MIN6_9ACTN|nr:SHOCT domain-containing protein [Carbonactinospora thermoautotrophica]KWW97720.1 hypothetical protein TH66_19660 [Carbonactinospora thermoautotrophica]KWW98633.1 putative integral membrane protein [Carbonactinospora thermoautotrophica]KWX08799.1 hypothetical protein TR74_13365 [Carbonactinospora thermoautotrophica]